MADHLETLIQFANQERRHGSSRNEKNAAAIAQEFLDGVIGLDEDGTCGIEELADVAYYSTPER